MGKKDCNRLPRAANGSRNCMWAKKQCTATLQNGADCASFSISGRRRCARRRGANGSSREKGKGPARPPEGDSCGSPRAESSLGGPRALGKKVAPNFFLALFLSLKRDPSFVARDHS